VARRPKARRMSQQPIGEKSEPAPWRGRALSGVAAAAGAVALLVVGAVVTPLGERVAARFMPNDEKSNAPAVSPSPDGRPSTEILPPSVVTINAARVVEGGAAVGASAVDGALAVTAVHVVGNACSGSPGWRVPLDRAHLGAAPQVNDSYAWAAGHGGEEVSGTHVQLTLQAIADTVTVTDIRATIIDKKLATPGTRIVPYGECGAPAEKHLLLAKLDDTPPQVYNATDLPTPDGLRRILQAGSRLFDTHTLELAEADTEVFDLFARARAFDYSWGLAVHWTGPDGRPHITNITDDGQPFRTVPRPPGRPLSSAPTGAGRAEWRTAEVPDDE
jgi:cell division septation protein DedD